MPINDALLGSLISAASGILGVAVASVIVPPVREHFSKARNARYLAIRVVCILDKYVEDCASTAIDDGIEENEGIYIAQVKAPPPPIYPDDVDWKSIEHSLMYQLLALPAAAERAASYVASAADDATPPDCGEYFEARSHQYSLLGLQAHDLTVTLRKAYSVPEPTNRVWDPVSHMKETLKRREELQARRSVNWEQLLPSLPVTGTVARSR